MYIPFGSTGICEVEKVTPTEMNEILDKWESYGRTEKVLLGNKCPTPGIKQYFESYYRNNILWTLRRLPQMFYSRERHNKQHKRGGGLEDISTYYIFAGLSKSFFDV